ncbi:claudin-34-like [Girardinichthys multiradiatus]|uniref:claudin-34-like n=1 Tax=Girardinichthys multiradiatus TaxID=208333 RepID=UPI001FAB8BEA|nr:claudin-34-like [Girardinichthys multiradiatus]
MTYLAHTAHTQFAALWLALIGWTLTAVSPGLVQWREWEVPDNEVVTSGVAWVGIWRACFNSHTHVSEGLISMYCRSISLTENFTPPEIAAGQVLMLLSLLVGLCGNAAGAYAMRNAYFGVKRVSLIFWGFITTGVLVLLAAALSLVPLIWNLKSVVTNQTIDFPSEFKLPKAPRSQHVGCGIGVGIVGSVLMVVSGMIFCSYRFPQRFKPRRDLSKREQLQQNGSAASGARNEEEVSFDGKDNPAFQGHEHM